MENFPWPLFSSNQNVLFYEPLTSFDIMALVTYFCQQPPYPLHLPIFMILHFLYVLF